MKKNAILIAIFSFVTLFATCLAMSQAAREKGFVYINEVDPTILTAPRYATSENFVGEPIDGYKKPVIMMTFQAAEALKKAQSCAVAHGYCLVVYDAYRPQRAVNHFMRWSKNLLSQVKKAQYYPRVDKDRVFELGYVAERSGHSRGSTVDVTLIKNGESLHAIQTIEHKLTDGFTITLLDDGTVDMGSSFDLFDVASHIQNILITEEYMARRAVLRECMVESGFKTYAEEWWHFTLVNEPYPACDDSSYFDFEVE